MPTIGKKSGGGFKPSVNKGRARKQTMNASLSRRGAKPSRNRQGYEDEDAVLSPDVDFQDNVVETGTEHEVHQAEPFSDGLVSAKLRGLTVIPRVGGEECSVLGDFLVLFSRTEPFIGAVSTKTSYMKKQGGRLL